MLDLLILNGRVIDGTGRPWFRANVGIKDGRIAYVGRQSERAHRAVDAKGAIVCPGFVDQHTHGELANLDARVNEAKVRQGITTEIGGNCGLGVAPLSEEHAQEWLNYISPVFGRLEGMPPWRDMDGLLTALEQADHAHNFAMLAGDGAMRAAVKGFEKGDMSPAEREAAGNLLRDSLIAGAYGLSFGIYYIPEAFSSIDTLAHMARVAAEFDAPLSVHMRGESATLLTSVNEALEVARRSGVKLNISHFKAVAPSAWAMLDEAIEAIERARAEGIDVTVDAYPYTAGATTLTTLLPPWAQEGGKEKLLARLRDADTRGRIKGELECVQSEWDNVKFGVGWDKFFLNSCSDESLMGKSVGQIAAERGCDEYECFFDLLVENDGSILSSMFYMRDEDVKRILALPYAMLASDSIYIKGGRPHPRLCGAFPKLLRMVREDKFIPLEEAVRKMTSFPAQRFGLKRKGLLLEGMDADIVIFDENTVSDNATFTEPTLPPDGISHVFVAGEGVVEDGDVTGATPGVIMRRRL